MEYVADIRHTRKPNFLVTNLIENEFIQRRNALIDFTNPLLDSWNNEWFAIHSELKDHPMEEGSAIYDEYNQFIANKAVKYVKIINAKKMCMNLVTISWQTDGDIIGFCEKHMDLMTIRIRVI